MRYVWEFIAILVITLALMTLYSFSNKTIHIGKLELKKTGIKEFVVGDTAAVDAIAAADFTWQQPEMDSSKQVILFIGDSMLESLRFRMRDYCEYNGHELHTVIWYSAGTKWFGEYDTLDYFINKFKPTYIVLVLGANELFIRDVAKRRAWYVKQILRKIGDIPYVWVGPPNWKKDTGINDLILSYVGRKRFFPSYKMTLTPEFERAKDGSHPTRRSASRWMDSIAVWIMTQSAHPILMEKPPHPGKESTHTVVLQPLKN